MRRWKKRKKGQRKCWKCRGKGMRKGIRSVSIWRNNCLFVLLYLRITMWHRTCTSVILTRYLCRCMTTTMLSILMMHPPTKPAKRSNNTSNRKTTHNPRSTSSQTNKTFSPQPTSTTAFIITVNPVKSLSSWTVTILYLALKLWPCSTPSTRIIWLVWSTADIW